MSNDLEHRHSPPDFGYDDTKDDDQMFKSASLPVTDDIQLSEEDEDENPFGDTSVRKKPLTNTIESSITNGTPIAVPEPQPSTPIKQDNQFFPTDSGVNSTEINTPVPVRSTASFENQLSASAVVSKPKASETTNSKPIQKQSDDYNIEITVSDPTKVGEVCILSSRFYSKKQFSCRVYHPI